MTAPLNPHRSFGLSLCSPGLSPSLAQGGFRLQRVSVVTHYFVAAWFWRRASSQPPPRSFYLGIPPGLV